MAASPLRYPGGKAKMYGFFVDLIKHNCLYKYNYCEPYAGGGGLALKLLTNGFVDRITLNDIDDAIYAFWHSILNDTEKFCQRIEEVDVNIDEWHRQRSIWERGESSGLFELGFSTYFLNRTNRSGIIDGAGPIGGYAQSGAWKLNVRFSKEAQIRNIRDVGRFSSCINISKVDAFRFVEDSFSKENTFLYLDPPYYVKGSKLYRNSYNHEDHKAISALVQEHLEKEWVVSYDDVPQIRQLYKDVKGVSYALNYSAGTKGAGREVLYMSDAIRVPVFEGYRSIA